MDPRFSQFPRDLASRARSARLGPAGVPTLLAHPDWEHPAPVMFWMHGRTVNKELDPGRYLRWIRAGIAAVSIDLPGHGERLIEDWQTPARSMDVLEQAVGEVGGVLDALSGGQWGGVFDLSRVGIGGMSAGGMAALRRVCEPAPASVVAFRAVSVEGSTGWLEGLYAPERAGLPRAERVFAEISPDRLERLDPMRHLAAMPTVPMLVLHSEADRVVPWQGMAVYVERVRSAYRARGADPGLVRVRTWPETGAPQEHAGFGRFANDAKNLQVEFLASCLGVGGTGGA